MKNYYRLLIGLLLPLIASCTTTGVLTFDTSDPYASDASDTVEMVVRSDTAPVVGEPAPPDATADAAVNVSAGEPVPPVAVAEPGITDSTAPGTPATFERAPTPAPSVERTVSGIPATTPDGTDQQAPPVAPVSSDISSFVLGAGDKIRVEVWRNTELDRTVQIDPEGNVDLPVIGPILAAGLSITEFRAKLTRRLAKNYLANPQVTVNVDDLRSRKVFVLGEVKSPGSFSLDPRMAPWEVISNASGFTQDADKKKVLLVRSEGGVARASVIDVDTMLRAGKGVPRIFMRDRDLIYVPPSKIANVSRFMSRVGSIVSPILGVESSIILGQDVIDVLEGKNRAKDVIVTK